MNEDFVPFELAVKLKGKGFNEPCIAHYRNNQLYIAHYINAFHNESKESIDTPTISQVLKWLREEKKIHIEFVAAAYGYNIIISQTPEEGGTDYYFSHNNYDGPNDGGAWDTYEQAVIAGIEYTLDNLI